MSLGMPETTMASFNEEGPLHAVAVYLTRYTRWHMAAPNLGMRQLKLWSLGYIRAHNKFH
jgi:hypothetical protein